MDQNNSFARLQAAWAVLQALHNDDDNGNAIDDMMFAWPVSLADAHLHDEGGETASNVALTPFQPNVLSTDPIQSLLDVIRDQGHNWDQQTSSVSELPSRQDVSESVKHRTLLISPKVDASHHDCFEPFGLFVQLKHIDAADEEQILVDFKRGMGSDTQAQSIARQLRHILRQLATVDRSTSIESLDMVPPEDLRHIWSLNRDVPPAIRKTVTSLLSTHLEQRPDAPAICAWDGELSYGELNVLSTRLSQFLVQKGVRPGVIVPICFERSLWAPVAMLAVIKAGGAGLTIDVTQPEERLRANVSQVLPAPVILSSMTCGDFALRLAPEAENFRVSRETIESLSSAASTPDLPELSPTDPICIVFTSGSTGKPKGITLTHMNFSSALFHQSKRILIHENSRVYYFASFAFDAAWHNLLHTLYNGACLCVPSESERKNDVSGSICRYRATWADLTPRLGELLEDRALNCLELLQLAGERPNPTIINRIRKLVSVRFAYGPAECAVMSTISSDDAHFTSVGSGCGLRTWIVYPDGTRLMPVGSVGELWLEGPLVGKGYMHDPEKTARAFVQDPPWLLRGCPETSGRHGRLYRTGDLVRYDGGDDGGLTFIGRKDGQVKIRGQRVELAEVDHHVWQQLRGAKTGVKRDGNHEITAAHVRVAAEVVKFANSNRPLLVAFVCLAEGAPSPLDKAAVAAPGDPIAAAVRELTQDLDQHLSAVMPSYMVPSAFIPVTAIPVTPTCKSDRRRLREMTSTMTLDQLAALSDRKQDRVEPSTPQEKQLQKLWSKVMDIDPEKISAEDNFYRIGGDSIVAMKLIGLARKEGIRLTVAKILRYPCLADLAKTLPTATKTTSNDNVTPFSLLGGNLDRQTICAEVAAACNVPASSVQDVLPCSPLQEGLLALSSSRGDYITRHVFRLQPGTDLERFREAWAAVISANPILRTRIIDLPGHGLFQTVLDSPPDWQVTKGSSFRKSVPPRISMGLGTCLSFFQIYDEGEQVYLTWTAHHALFDAWSIGMIFDAVSRAYHRASAPQVDSFAKFVRAIGATKEEDATNFWSTQFLGSTAASYPTLPSEIYRPCADTVVSETMENFSWRDDQHTVATAAKASWAIVQANLTEGEDVIFGSTLTGRQFPVAGIERIVGPTIATVPLRIVVDQTKTVHELLSSVQGQGIDMIAHEQAGMQRIRRIVKKVNASCDFQTILVVQPKQMALHNERGLLHDQVEGDILKDDKALNSVNSYALMVQFEIDGTSARIRLSFDSYVIGKEQAHHIARQLKQTFRQICTRSNQLTPIQDLELVAPEDMELLWKHNAVVPPAAKATAGCVHELISIMAQKQPEAPAICAWDGELSYRELDRLSTHLARHLVQIGIKPETIVPLCFEKSMWTPVAQLAVMKAGGACLVLDVDQPAERLRTLVQQVHPTILLTSVRSGPLAKRLSSVQSFSVGNTELQTLPENSSIILPSVSLSHIAYVVFTSGSTGIPKGAMVSHSNATSATILQTAQLKFKPTSRVLDFTSYAFDVTWSNFIHTLVVGGCLCIPSDRDRLNSLTVCVRTLQVNYVHIIPSVSHLLDYSQLLQLEVLHFSGEPLSSSVVNAVPSHIQIINSYGPAECTVTSTMKDIGVTRFREVDIGKPLGALAWVVRTDTKDLVPLGVAGELWLEGPLVGQGYLNDSEKTSISFVKDPPWLLRGSRTYSGRKGRLYRTGDLVRQNNDGNIVFISRADGQVKINGQRVELGEVEHNVRQQLPRKDVIFENVRLTAEVVKFSGSERPTLVIFVCPGLVETAPEDEEATRVIVQQLVNGLNERLAEHVPTYMIPSAYIPLASIPMTATGKTDRRRMRQIAAAMESRDAVHSSPETGDTITAPSTPIEHALRELWGSILGSPTESISTSESFTRLGGDSITAMQLVSRARNHPLKISIQTSDILRLATIQKIAKASKLNYQPDYGSLDLEDYSSTESWPLAPIQSLFFRLNPFGENYWNQSFALKLKDASHAPHLKAAIEAVVQRHQILGARFRRDEDGTWKQFIASDHKFTFEKHLVESPVEMRKLINHRHNTIDIEAGPVFAADVFSIADGNMNVLVLSAHHLVIDLVSWRIIWDDVERNLRGHSTITPAISFRQWCKLQERRLQTQKGDLGLPFKLREADLDYWGVTPAENTSDNFEVRTLTLDEAVTARILGASNSAFHTEPTDIIIAVLIETFRKSFVNRHVPPIWVEGHGRETADDHNVDLSETVGWFTTLYPIQVSGDISPPSDLIDTLRETKDLRKQIQPHSRQFFAKRQVHQKQLGSDDRGLVEVLLNYIGRYDQVQSSDSLFTSLDGEATVDIEQIGSKSRRLAVVELVIGVQNDQLQIRFAFNKLSERQNQLRQWLEQYVVELGEFSDQLCKAMPKATWADFPLLEKTSYQDLDSLMGEVAGMGLSIHNVREIYPCTPMQEGILLSKTRGAASYANHWIWTCHMQRNGKADANIPVSIEALEQAWQSVLVRHSIFATVFVEEPKTGKMLQLILNNPECCIRRIVTDKLPAGEALRDLDTPSFPPGTPEYQVTICQASSNNGSQDVACRLDMSHALTDASSTSIIVRDLQRAYEKQLQLSGPRFRDVVSAIQGTADLERQSYWVHFLSGARPCLVPRDIPQIQSKASTLGAHDVFIIPAPRAKEIFEFCRAQNVTQSTFLQVVWALVLYSCTGINEPCFGFLSSGRDIPVDGVEELVGPLINMLASRVSLQEPLDKILASTSSHLIDHLDHQHMSLAKVQHELGLRGKQLFNTSITIRNTSFRVEPSSNGLSLSSYHSEDLHEFDVTLAAEVSENTMDLLLTCRRDSVSRVLSREIRSVFDTAVNFILDHKGSTIASGKPQNLPSTKPTIGEQFCEERLGGVSEEEARSYWTTMLKGASGVAFPANPVSISLSSPERLTAQFAAPGTKSIVHSLETCVRAAWAILQAQYTDEDDVFFGNAVVKNNRVLALTPVRATVNFTDSVGGMLDHIQEQALKGHRFESSGLHWIRRVSNDLRLACEFRTLLTTSSNISSDIWDDLSKSYPLVIQASCIQESSENQLRVQMSFHPSIIDEERVRNISHQLSHVFNQLCELSMSKENMLVGELDLVSPEDLETIWSRNSEVIPAVEGCVHGLITETAQRLPEAPAICAWDGELLYKDFDMLSSRLAHYLISQGVGPGVIVPICCEKSVWNPVAKLAVMKAGGACLALDVNLPEERLCLIVQQVSPIIIVSSPSHTALARRLSGDSSVPFAVVGRALLDSLPVETSEALPTVSPTALLYVVFTSGSTGLPKAVMITHQNFCSAVKHQQKALGFFQGARVFDFVSYAFDVSWSNFLHSMTIGACLCIPSDDDRMHNTLDAMDRFQVTYANVTPSMERRLELWKATSLKVLSLSGEALENFDRGKYSEMVTIKNTYGPSECTVKSTIETITNGSRQNGSIGHAVGCNAWVVRSGTNKLVPPGSIGELWLEGPQVGVGYLSDTKKTASAFVKDPPWLLYGSGNGKSRGRKGRLYRTGDIVRQQMDGSLTFVGRKDGQVKLRGQRVELGEVEFYIRQQLSHDLTANAAMKTANLTAEVVTLANSQQPSLVVFVYLAQMTVADAEAASTAIRQLTQGLNERLAKVVPAYMVPSAYIPISNLPMTATGKLDRRRLRRMAADIDIRDIIGNQGAGVIEEPADNEERIIRDIWASALNMPPSSIPVTESFTRLGGDSITAMQIVARCRERQMPIRTADILRLQSIREITQTIKRATLNGSSEDGVVKSNLSLRQWYNEICKLQSADPHSPDLIYWGMNADTDNINVARWIESSQHLDAKTTAQLFVDANLAYRTEWCDIILASLHFTFTTTFSGRDTPPIFLEVSNSRNGESSGTSLPTTIVPLQLPTFTAQDIVSMVRHAKDVRRKFRRNGLVYTCKNDRFGGEHHSSAAVNDDNLVEIILNCNPNHKVNKTGTNQAGSALFEIDAGLHKDQLVLTFRVDNRIKQHREQIEKWFALFVSTIQSTSAHLSQESPGLTLSDVPLLQISYRGLDELADLVSSTIPLANVRDIYPCTPLQEGVLLSKKSGAASYANHWSWTCQTRRKGVVVASPISTHTLQRAWQSVLARHSVFATIFVDSPETGEILQLLLADVQPHIVQLHSGSVPAGQALQERRVPTYEHGQPEYMVIICEDSAGEVACRLDMNHALSDAASIPILIRDLKKAYDAYQNGQLTPLVPAPPFRNVIEAIGRTSLSERQSYWESFLHQVQPCRIPTDFARSTDVKARAHHIILISTARTDQILGFCRQRGITQSTFLHVVWALVLNACTGLDEPCFGFLSSGRDLALDQVEEVVGPLINILASRVSLQDKGNLDNILSSTSKDLIEHLNHQHMSLAGIHHHLGLHGDEQLFNTSITVRNASFRLSESADGLDLREHHNEDPHEFDMTLAVEVAGTALELALTCRRDTISTATAFEMKALFEAALSYVLDSSETTNSTIHNAGDLFFKSRLGIETKLASSYWSRIFDGFTAQQFPATETAGGLCRASTTISEGIESIFWNQTTYDISVLFQASWALAQADFTEEDDVVCGFTVTGRHAAVMPLRTVIDRAETIQALLDRLQQQKTEARPFEQTGLNFIRRINTTTERACQFRTLLINPEAKTSQDNLFTLDDYALVVDLNTSNRSAPAIDFRFDSQVMNEEEVRSISRLVVHALRQLCTPSNQSTVVGALSLLPPDEAITLWRRNSTVPDTADACMHQIIRDVALKQPQAQAICAWDGQLTYSELDDLSTHLALHLVGLGVKPGTIVPLCFEKCMLTSVAILAVMKAGGASVALDTTQPAERLRAIIQQVSSTKQVSLKVVLSSINCLQIAQQISPVYVQAVDHSLLDGLSSSGEPPSSKSLPSVSPSDALYVVFTSGSTGLPKGAMVSHRNAASTIALQKDALRFNASSRVLDSVSYAFDVTWSNFLYPLSLGGCLCVPLEDDRNNNLDKCIRDLRVNYLHITPSVGQLLDFSQLESLHTLSFIGEPLHSRVVNKVPPHIHVLNTYGPAECTVVATISDIGAKRNIDINIGNALGGNAWVIRNGMLAPLGSIGELWLEGPYVGLGYLGDVEKTTASFVEDPTWLTAGIPGHFPGRRGRLYRTGDLVRQRENGALAYVGRSDGQVKIRGQRLELGEVEYNVRKQIRGALEPETLQLAAEIVRLKESRYATLVVFVCLPTDDTLALAQLTDGLNERIAKTVPAYMIPSAYIPIGKRLPMTATGKTDRLSLRRLASSMTHAELASFQGSEVPDRREPSTQREKQLQLLWATVLGIDSAAIGADDSFFQVGGDSIIAMRLVGTARKQGLTVTVSDILQQPRLSDLARVISNSKSPSREDGQDIQPLSLLNESRIDLGFARAHVARICGISATAVEDILPCTPLQQGLLALTANRDGDYVGQHKFKLLPSTDKERFQRAWQTIAANTPILRTRIVDLPGQGLVQVVLDCPTIFHSEDSDISLGQGLVMGLGTPLSHFTLIQDSERGCLYFTWTIHHALYDAWSMSLIFDAVAKAYESNGPIITGHEPFSRFVKATVVDADKNKATAFWASQFEDLAAVPFPDGGPLTTRSRADSVILVPMDGDLLWKDDQYTIGTAIRAAWAICQSTYTDNEDIVFGTTVTGRQADVAGIDQITGPTIAAVPVRITIDRSSTVRALLQRAHDQAIQMIPYEQTGLAQIRQINKDTERGCQFQTLLVVQPEGSPGKEKELFIQESSKERVRAFTSYPLMIQVELQGATAQLRISFDSHIISQTMAQRIAWQLCHTLHQLCTASHQTTINRLDGVSSQDLDIMWKYNAQVPDVIESPVHDLITKQIKRQPTAPAVCAWDGDLSYGELDVLSTRLAYHLLRLGLSGPDVVVPLCFEKSMWTPVTMLAVIKSGSASVVLDVNQPEERLRTIVKLVSTPVILCSASQVELAASLISAPTQIIAVNGEFINSLPEDPLAPLPTISPSQRLCVIFTSGSTGTPKGIEIDHRNLSSAMVHQQEKLGFSPQTRLFSFASHSFDATWHNFLHTFWNGACLCIPSESERRNNLSGSIVKYKATFADFTPTVAQTLNSEALHTLKSMILVGEAGEMRVVNRIRQSTEVRFVYGPAECSVMTTISDPDAKCSNIGHQFGLCTWIVCRDGTQLVPSGAIGELWIEGPLVGRGYLADAERTKASFIETPYWLLRGSDSISGRRGRLYRTGDLVRREDDGSLTFIGRKDDQVKLRGQRVELGEVEHHVLQHLRLVTSDDSSHNVPVAAEVVTLSNSKRPTLVVFVCPSGASADSEEGPQAMATAKAEVQRLTKGINERLSETLPIYMIPSAYIPLLRLPMTATGKTDRRRLREMGSTLSLTDLADLSSSAGSQERTAPSTAREKQLQELWSTVLGIDKSEIYAEDTFFRAGGDSISAMRLVEAARVKGLTMTVSDIMQHPRLNELAPLLQTNSAADVEAPPPFSLVTEEEQRAVISRPPESFGDAPFTPMDAYPASFVQRYYIEDSSETRFGVHFLLVDLPPSVDVARLTEGCQRAVGHIDILRTIFTAPCGRTLQVVLKDLHVPFDRFDNVHSLDQTTKQICQEYEMDTLYNRRILHFFFLRDGEHKARLIVRISHAQYDAVTLPAVLSALGRFYSGGDADDLPPFASAIRNFISTNAGSLPYWRSLLRDSIMSSPATPPSSGLAITNPVITSTRTVSAKALKQLRDITPAHYFTAACAVMLARLTNSRDVLFGRLVSGRAGLPGGITNASGPCINTVPVRAVFQKEVKIGEVISQIVQQYVDGIPHEQVGFDDLREKCASWPTSVQNFKVVTKYQNVSETPPLEIEEFKPESRFFEGAMKQTRFDMIRISGFPEGESLRLVVAANSSQCSEDRLEAIIGELAGALAASHD